MDKKKPTYEELVKKLAEAEELIAALIGNERNVAEKRRDIAEGQRDYARGERDDARSERDVVTSERDIALGSNKDLKEAYIESEQNFHNSMDACPLGIRVVTKDGDLIYANQAILDICGYRTIEELNTVPKEQLYTPESYAAHVSRKEKRKQGEFVPPEYEISIRRPDGAVSNLRVFREEIIWGGKHQFMVMYEDITKRKLAEEALKQQEEFLNSVIDNTPSPLWVSDEKGTVIRMNQALRDLLQVIDKEVVGKYNVLKDRQVIEQGFLPLVKSVFEEGKTASFTLKYQTNKETQVNPAQPVDVVLDIVMSAVKNEQGKITHVICQEKDITDRKKAEEALRESEIQYHSVVDNSKDAILLTSPDGTILTANPVACVMFGRTEEDIRRGGRDVIIDPSDFRLKQALEKRESQGEFSGELTFVRADGTRFPGEISTKVFFDKSGKAKTSMIIRDITDRKKVEEELAESESKFRNLFEQAMDATFLVDINTGIIFDVNTAAGKLLDLPKDKILGIHHTKLHPPEMVEKYIKLFSEHAEKGKAYSEDVFVQNANGDHILVDISASVIELGGKRVILGVFRDITERRKMEASLRYHASLVESVSDTIISSNVNYIILSWNKAAEEMYGWREEEVIGKTVMEVTKSVLISDTQQEIRRILLKDNHWRGEAVHQRRNGEKFNVLVSVSLLKDEKGEEIGAVTIFKDITERKKAEEALKASEEKFRVLSEKSVVGVYIIQDNKIVYANPSAARFFGYETEEIIGFLSPADLIHPDDLPLVLQKIQERQEGLREKSNTYYRGKKKDGSTIFIEVYGMLITYQGQPAVMGTLLDVTQRIKAEEKYQTVVKTTLDGFAVSDLKGNFLEVNDSFCQLLGYTRPELLKLKMTDIDVNSTPEELEKRANTVISTGSGRFEIQQKHKDGHLIDVELSVKYHADKEGQMFVFIHDVTARRASEESIKHLNMTLRSIRNVNQLITREKDRDNLIQGICANLVVSRSFGSAWIILLDGSRKPVTWAESKTGGDFLLLVESFKQGNLPRCVQKALKQKQVVVTEDPHSMCPDCPLLAKNREIGSLTVRLELEGNIYGILCASLPRILLASKDEISLFREVAADITFALRDIELGAVNELLQQERLRAAKLESIGTLAGGIAHDFNNLLTGIMGNIGLAKNYLPPNSEVFDMLDEAEKAAIRSRDLTQQLLTFARGGKPIKKILNVHGLIKDSATFALHGSKVRLELSLPAELWQIEADEGQISQVIHNLVINAYEAMPDGGIIKITAKNLDLKRMDTLPLSRGIYILIDVCDTGIGISPEHLQKIFEPYFTTKQQGSGLGLASAYSIIKNHGGYLLAESTPNKGSVFHIYLPASRKTKKREKKVAAKKSTQAGGKVLIMDDDATIRKMLKNMLNLAGYEVEDAADGVEAIMKYKKALDAHNPFTTVIMDLTIPGGMGGKEAMKNLLEIDPAAAVIVSSGYATDAIMSEYKKYGFSAVIAKPYSIKQLQETIAGLSSKKKN